jgi:hypothetical protein
LLQKLLTVKGAKSLAQLCFANFAYFEVKSFSVPEQSRRGVSAKVAENVKRKEKRKYAIIAAL